MTFGPFLLLNMAPFNVMDVVRPLVLRQLVPYVVVWWWCEYVALTGRAGRLQAGHDEQQKKPE